MHHNKMQVRQITDLDCLGVTSHDLSNPDPCIEMRTQSIPGTLQKRERAKIGTVAGVAKPFLNDVQP